MPDAALILLAAGNSSRMGTAKQLLDFGGKPLLRRAAETALATACRPVIVVLGARAGEVRTALDGLDVEIVENPDWERGMGTSIQAGLAAIGDRALGGAILALADQPLVTPRILDGLVATHRSTGKPIVPSRYLGTVGVPVFFARQMFGELRALQPSQGCKGVILANWEAAAPVDCPEAAADLDTPEDYRKFLST